MIDLEAIRARDADDYAAADVLRNIRSAGNTDPELEATINMIADRRDLLAAYDALSARLAEADTEATVLVVAMADQCGAPDNWKPLPDVAGKITQISNMAAGLRERIADLEAERALIVARAENAERALEEANERHGRYIKAVGELAGMAARLAEAEALLREESYEQYRLTQMTEYPSVTRMLLWHMDRKRRIDAHLSRKEGET